MSRSTFRIYIAFLLFVMLHCVSADDVSFYGDISSLLFKREFNSSSPYASVYDEDKDIIAALVTNLYLSVSDDFMGNFFLEGYADGSLTNTTSNTGDISVAPISCGVRQVYFQVLPMDSLVFTIGKKYKSIGYSQFFNVSNRLTPEAFSSAGESSEGIGLVELDFYFLPSLTLESLVYFPADAEWDQVSLAIGTKAQFNLFNLDFYGYLDEFDEISFGYNAAFQRNILKLYIEGLLSDHVQQGELNDNPVGNVSEDISIEERFSLQQTVGMTFYTDYASYTAEYMYRLDGPEDIEREKLLDYIDSISITDKSSAIDALYRVNQFDSHYFAFNGNIFELLPGITNSVMLDLTAIISAGKDPGNWDITAGFTDQAALTIVDSSGNSGLTLWFQSSYGGTSAEYRVFPDLRWLAGLVFSYNFSAN